MSSSKYIELPAVTIENVGDFHSHRDVFIMPSKEEDTEFQWSLCSSLGEAMLPVLATVLFG